MTYDIVTTLGPASDRPEIWQAMRAAGTTAFRLNTSHLSLPELSAWIERVIRFFNDQDSLVSLVLDLQGSKWRLGSFPPVDLLVGQRIELVLGAETHRAQSLPVPHEDFFLAAPLSTGEIVLNDAKVRLMVEQAGSEALIARVTQAGPIASHKGITFADSPFRQERLSAKDQEILATTQTLGFVRYAISYVRDALEMARYRQLAGPSAFLIAKLERGAAIRETELVARSADELWVCRGDLGAELGYRAMAEAVHRLSPLVSKLPVRTLMAGQVLEHMTTQPTPTRSEVCYLYDTLALGYRGFVLSDEAAIGKYPVESVKVASMFK